ncbi:MAG TPA: VIT1/CCC1 transporter family protein [Acidimicrobiales bacterium]|nr:VIT1/CCC1 transporter family protein [Acidimicrobiales bacterium]
MPTPTARPAGALALLRRLTARPEPMSRHRDVQGGAARAAILGAGDGLLTNVSLILGVAGAQTSGSYVRLAGVAGMLAGAFSMAAGELVSVRAQRELAEREIAVEAAELREAPEEEREELAAMYRARGVPADDADTVARILSADHAIALDTHARLELGIDPNQTGQASRAAVASFVAFGSGAVLPLLPWFFAAGSAAVVASIVIAAVAAAVLGMLIGKFTGQGLVRTGGRQLAVAAVSAAVTYGVGHLVGVGPT